MNPKTSKKRAYGPALPANQTLRLELCFPAKKLPVFTFRPFDSRIERIKSRKDKRKNERRRGRGEALIHFSEHYLAGCIA